MFWCWWCLTVNLMATLLKTQQSGAFFTLCNGKVTLLTVFLKTTSHNVMQGGSRASTAHTWGLACKIAGIENNNTNKKNKTHLKVVVCVSLCISVCLSGAASLSFCLLLFVPSPHFSGLRSYCCPNNPSSRKKEEKGGPGLEVVEEEDVKKSWRVCVCVWDQNK